MRRTLFYDRCVRDPELGYSFQTSVKGRYKVWLNSPRR